MELQPVVPVESYRGEMILEQVPARDLSFRTMTVVQ
jgi:hypothetical protein